MAIPPNNQQSDTEFNAQQRHADSRAMNPTPPNTGDTELRAKIEKMFASAWQDGVHHLNPTYLRRDTLFTNKVMQLIADHDRALIKTILAEDMPEKETTTNQRASLGFNRAIDRITTALEKRLEKI